MLNSAMIETAIGLSLIFMLFSLFVSAMQELLASLFDSRAKFLREGVENLLYCRGKKQLSRRVLSHPVLNALNRGERDLSIFKRSTKKGVMATPLNAMKRGVERTIRLFRTNEGKRFVTPTKGDKQLKLNPPGVVGPSYIPTQAFSEALLDTVADLVNLDRSDPRTLPQLRKGILRRKRFSETQVARTLVHLIDRAERRMQSGTGETELLEEIGEWFDAGMDQVTGWYRRHTQKVLLGAGLVLAAILNVDAIRITKELYENPAVRAEAVAAAELVQALPEQSTDTSVQTAVSSVATAASELEAQMDSVGIPIGWAGITLLPDAALPDSRAAIGPWLAGSVQPWAIGWLQRIIGWLFTGIAASLGAPFWFDLLQRFITIRGAGGRRSARTGSTATRAGTADAASSASVAADEVAASGPPIV